MNENCRRLMLDAGYAAPELAVRAQRLVALVLEECNQISKETEHNERNNYMGDDVPPCSIRWAIKKHFKETE